MAEVRRSNQLASPMSRRWQCENCRTLLGTDNGIQLKFKYKDAGYRVTGSEFAVETVCRNCGTFNQRTRPERAP